MILTSPRLRKALSAVSNMILKDLSVFYMLSMYTQITFAYTDAPPCPVISKHNAFLCFFPQNVPFFPTLRKFHFRLVHISSLTMYAASTFPFNIFSIQGEILPRCKRGAGDRGTKREDEMEKKEEMRRRSGGGIVQKEEKAHCVLNS